MQTITIKHTLKKASFLAMPDGIIGSPHVNKDEAPTGIQPRLLQVLDAGDAYVMLFQFEDSGDGHYSLYWPGTVTTRDNTCVRCRKPVFDCYAPRGFCSATCAESYGGKRRNTRSHNT